MKMTRTQIALLTYEGISLTYTACFFTANANTVDYRLYAKFTYWSFASAVVANISTTIQVDKLYESTKQGCKAALGFNLILPITYYACVLYKMTFTQFDSTTSWYGLLSPNAQSFNMHCIHPLVTIQQLLSEPIRQQLIDAKLPNIPSVMQHSVPIVVLFKLYALTLLATLNLSESRRPVYGEADSQPIILALAATLAIALTHGALALPRYANYSSALFRRKISPLKLQIIQPETVSNQNDSKNKLSAQ